MFKVLNPTNTEDTDFLAQMHNLRYRVFYKTLHWRNGLNTLSQMEFDNYDHDDCRYLVHLNPNNKVDACTRLTPTCFPHLLGYTYQSYIEQPNETPSDNTSLETSRLCSDPASAPKNITGQLMAAMLEIGVNAGFNELVSLSDVRIKPLVRRYGWAYTELGPEQHTGTETSVALSYEIDQKYLDNVRQVVGITGNLLTESDYALFRLNNALPANDNGKAAATLTPTGT